MHATHNFAIADVGKLLVIGKEGLQEVFLFPREGKLAVRAQRFDAIHGGGEICAGRLKDAKLLATVEPMHGNQLVAYVSNTFPCAPGVPDRIVLTDHLAEGHALACGDLLGIGSDQIIVGWRGGKGGVRLWSAGTTWGTKWRESVIDDGGMACEDLKLVDLDADGELDIIASGRSTHNVKIYWNQTGQ
jgi:hypothetical protein